MAGLFAKAAGAAKAAAAPAKAKKSTTWVVGSAATDVAVAESVNQLKQLSADSKAIDAKMEIHKAVVKQYANQCFVRDFAAMGVMPDTPMTVVSPEGHSVTFVAQDRSGQYSLKPENQAALEFLLGEKAAADLIYTETTLGFDRLIMALPGVSEALEAALEKVVKKMVGDGTLTEDQSEMLITADLKTALRPGTLARAAQITGNDQVKLGAMLDACGSSVCRYVKP